MECAWRFRSYHPSPVEVAWKADIASRQSNVCSSTLALAQDTSVWLQYSGALPAITSSRSNFNPAPQPGTGPGSSELYHVLSTLEYQWTCTLAGAAVAPVDETLSHLHAKTLHVPIEPLAGPLRSPRMCEADMLIKHLFDRDYLIADVWAVHSVDVPTRFTQLGDGSVRTSVLSSHRGLYFDLGASTWKNGYGGPSQPYFVELVCILCVSVCQYLYVSTLLNPP